MEIRVFNRDEIEKFVTDEPHVVISVFDPEKSFPSLPDNNKSRKAHLSLSFHDIDNPVLKHILFNKQHGLMIIDFFNQWRTKVKLICVSCEVGLSISPAIAGALAILLGESDQKFFNYYMPNKYVYKVILDTQHELDMLGGYY